MGMGGTGEDRRLEPQGLRVARSGQIAGQGLGLHQEPPELWGWRAGQHGMAALSRAEPLAVFHLSPCPQLLSSHP